MAIMAVFGRHARGVPHRFLGFCVLLGLLCLTGCGLLNIAPDTKAAAKDPAFQACVAKFYLPYAVLAAAAYGTDTQADFSRALRDGRKDEIDAAQEAVKKEAEMPAAQPLSLENRAAVFGACRLAWENRNKGRTKHFPCNSVLEDCGGGRQPEEDTALSGLPLACGAAFQTDSKPPAALNTGSSPYVDEYPQANIPADCNPKKESMTKVPVSKVARSVGWQRRRDIERYATIREWMIFVPGLGIEVWSRVRQEQERQKHENPSREYAIVFRGTSDAGGWFSNLRIITGLIPMFWDQYQQAEWSTRQIVEQIRFLELDEWLREHSEVDVKQPEELAKFDEHFPYITTVGHSLGAGLAKYVYFKIKEISKVVGFNPSPVDGARTLIGLEERPRVMTGRRRPEPIEACSESSRSLAEGARAGGQSARNVAQAILDGDKKSPLLQREFEGQSKAAFYYLYEHGDILSSITPCGDGPEWGSEGGPESKCQMVELSKEPYTLTGMFKQHRMNMLACKLAAVLWRAPAPAVTQGDVSGHQ